MSQRIEHSWWEASVSLRELDDKPVLRNFSTRELALAATKEAMTKRLAEVKAKPNASEIREESSGINDEEHFNQKIVWWKSTSQGYVAQKDYFSVRPKTFELDIEA